VRDVGQNHFRCPREAIGGAVIDQAHLPDAIHFDRARFLIRHLCDGRAPRNRSREQKSEAEQRQQIFVNGHKRGEFFSGGNNVCALPQRMATVWSGVSTDSFNFNSAEEK